MKSNWLVGRPWDYPENIGIYSQLNRKIKNCFFRFLNVYVSWIKPEKILISQLSVPKFKYFADQNGPKRDPMKMNFNNSKYKHFHKRSSKSRWKNGFICLGFCLFLQFFVDTSKINEAVVAIYVYVSESSHFALLENGIRYYAMT